MNTINTTLIPIVQIERNNGQIAGLPKNPRLIKNEKYKLLLQSIKDNPEMLNLRELLVYPYDGNFVVIGGNMRLAACKELKYRELPCKVLPAETTIEQLKAYTIKDNSGFGEWDFDLLANEWDINDLQRWGIDGTPDLSTPEIDEPQLDEEDDAEIIDGREEGENFLVELSFTLPVREYNKVVEYLNTINKDKNAAIVELTQR